MAFGTEYAVNPTVFVGGEAHVVDVGGRNYIVGHGDGIVPKAEIVYAIGAFGHGKERLAVVTLDAHHQQVLTIPLNELKVALMPMRSMRKGLVCSSKSYLQKMGVCLAVSIGY